jgi:DNA sulfur modification protein DndC
MLAETIDYKNIIPTVSIQVPDKNPTLNRRPVDFDNEDEVLIEEAIERMTELLINGHLLLCAWSGGKDSSSVLVILINAMLRCRERGHAIPKCFIVTADTLIENPEVSELKYAMMGSLQDFAEDNDLPIECHVSMPSVMNTFQVQVIGGQTLPTFANSVYRQCSFDLKVTPNLRKLKEIEKSLTPEEKSKLVTMLGSRYDESTVRSLNIRKQGGSSLNITTDKSGKHFFYPIVSWTQDTVWWNLARAGSDDGKTWESFMPNHDELADLYRDSAGGECVVFQPDTKEGNGIAKDGKDACGARHGCSLCLAVDEDKSMVSLVEMDENKWMKPLLVIRRTLATLRYDWSKRRVGSRSIVDGYIKLDPNTLNFSTCRDLLAACLTADRDEQLRADMHHRALSRGQIEDNAKNRRMSRPQFQLISEQILLGIQWNWSVLGMEHKAFSALKVWQEIFMEHDGFYFPENPEQVKRTPVPKSRYLYVGKNWFEGDIGYSGLFDALGEAVSRDSLDACKLSTTLAVKTGEKVSVNGKIVPEVVNKIVPYYDEEQAFTIDEESAAMFMQFEAEYQIEKNHNAQTLPAKTAQTLMRMGIVKLPYSKRGIYDMMVARATYLRHKGLHGDLTYDELVERDLGTSVNVKKTMERTAANRKRRNTNARRNDVLVKSKVA